MRRQGRAAWTQRRVDPPRQNGPRQGVAVHWPGGDKLTIRTHADCLHYLAAWERFHVEGRGWSALAYNQAACRHGYLIEGRGVDAQSGANGNQAANDVYGSVLAILGPGERSTWRLRRAIRAARRDQARGKPLTTHDRVRRAFGLGGTDCPGPHLTTWVRNGAKLLRPKRRGNRPPAVSLQLVRRAARRAEWSRRGSKARQADVELVRQALDDVNAHDYAAWQRRLGYSGADADGVPGRVSLRRLGRKTGRFRATA